jgi:hypothetical protein
MFTNTQRGVESSAIILEQGGGYFTLTD